MIEQCIATKLIFYAKVSQDILLIIYAFSIETRKNSYFIVFEIDTDEIENFLYEHHPYLPAGNSKKVKI